MSLLNDLLSAGDGGAVKQLASQFGLTGDQALSAVTTLIPALAGGLKETLASSEGAPSDLSKLIMGGSLSKFAENPASLASSGALDQGKSLLKMIFGGGDTSNLASMAGEKAGLSGSVVSSMLPVVMTLLAGFLSKNAASGSTSLTDLVGDLTGGGGIFGAIKDFAQKITS